jgi:hypothetical protein
MKPNEMSVRDYMAMNIACAEISSREDGIPGKDEWRTALVEISYKMADEMLSYGKKTEPKEPEFKQIDYKSEVLKLYPEAKVDREKGFCVVTTQNAGDFIGIGATEQLAWRSAYQNIKL